jgi:hypothetical protein
MRMLKSIIFAAAALVAFASCQKELKFDNSGASSGAFKKDAGGDCSPITVNGIFKKDSVLTTANFVDVQVNVSYPGTFDIKSDSVNGYSFSKTGSVVLGANTLRLYATGKPVSAGTDKFTIKYGTSNCTFNITVPGPGVVPAGFTLSGSPGACLNATVGGVYTVNTQLAPLNTLTIEIDVTTTGTYVIAASAVPANGFAFTGSGTFTSVGKQLVTLTGTGTPQRAEVSAVNVTNISSTCTIPVTVQPSAPPAVFTLNGAPGTCTGFTVAGVYTAGSASSASNTVKLNVNVTTAGSYNITTNTVNGISFSGTGTLALGQQTIILTATGIPAVAGTFNTFKPNIASSCDFAVTFVPATLPLNGDYFPLTNNSWWSYDIVGQPDTIYNVVYGTKVYNTNTYTEVQENFGGAPNDTVHYRKSGNNYFQWVISDWYSAQFAFDNPAVVDINFLKENTATGTTWQSATYSGPIGSGSANADLKYDFKIENANTSIVVNGKSYTNVIYVSVTVQLKIAPSPVFTAFEKNDFYYAKGIGLIKVKYNDLLGGMVLGEVDIRNYKVN